MGMQTDVKSGHLNNSGFVVLGETGSKRFLRLAQPRLEHWTSLTPPQHPFLRHMRGRLRLSLLPRPLTDWLLGM